MSCGNMEFQHKTKKLQINNDNNKMKQVQQPLSLNANFNKVESTSKKFLNHFQSINTPVKIPPTFLSASSISKNKYQTTMQYYANSNSIIDKIADSPVKQSRISHAQLSRNDIVSIPMIVSVNPKIKQRLNNINKFFNPSLHEKDYLFQESVGGFTGYIQNIININTSNVIQRNQQDNNNRGNNSRSKSKQSIPQPNQNVNKKILSPQVTQPSRVHQVEVNTQPIIVAQKVQNNRLKKIDLLLVQIMREKKRKGLVSDYYKAIEMKLGQLLQYILHDEPEFYGLSLPQKMKEVLKNLQHFKGRAIDGQSKVNMLRIFFEQFRNLKKQKDDQDYSRQNRIQSRSKKSGSKAQSKKSGPNSSASPLMPKSKKNYDTMSMGGNRPSIKNGTRKNEINKSTKQEDQWIGSLQN